jgi:hypothetical protein
MNNHAHYAFPADAGIETVIRFGEVSRWHMIRTDRRQTLAEHSANVALLAMYLARTAPDMYFGSGDSIAAAALTHDIEEVFTGDIPTPVKRYLTGLSELEKALRPEAMYPVQVTDRARELIKVCDLADTLRFIHVHGKGRVAKHAEAGIGSAMVAKAAEAWKIWPRIVAQHVFQSIYLYVYETRNDSAWSTVTADEKPVADDLARGPGNIPGGS